MMPPGHPVPAISQERVMQKRQGIDVGKCMLFFGARYKQVPRSSVAGVAGVAGCGAAPE